MAAYVRDFAEGDRSQSDLLGGKGANLAEMCRLGLPVPPGFTITTEACQAYLRDGAVLTVHGLPFNRTRLTPRRALHRRRRQGNERSTVWLLAGQNPRPLWHLGRGRPDHG